MRSRFVWTPPTGFTIDLASVHVAGGHLVFDCDVLEPNGTPQMITVGDLTVDEVALTIRLNGRAIRLSKKEHALLWCLAQMPGRTLTIEELQMRVWGYEYPTASRTVNSHASRLRVKLGGWIVNEWGTGYRLEVPA